MESSYDVKPATMADLKFMQGLIDANGDCLGFVPFQQLQTMLERRLGLTAWLNGERCGLLLTNGLGEIGKIQYTCIQKDARRKEHATALVNDYKRRLLAAGGVELRLRCRLDLEANLFWQAMGMQTHGTHWPRNRQIKPLIMYRQILDGRGELFSDSQIKSAKIDQLHLWARAGAGR